MNIPSLIETPAETSDTIDENDEEIIRESFIKELSFDINKLKFWVRALILAHVLYIVSFLIVYGQLFLTHLFLVGILFAITVSAFVLKIILAAIKDNNTDPSLSSTATVLKHLGQYFAIFGVATFITVVLLILGLALIYSYGPYYY